MKYRIEHETKNRMRIHMYGGRITPAQAEILQFAFSSIHGVSKVTLYPATGGCAVEYNADRDYLIEKLNKFRYENVTILTREEAQTINREELRLRKLDPALKRKLRLRVAIEAAADLLLPWPVQLGYHAYQMITLKDI